MALFNITIKDLHIHVKADNPETVNAVLKAVNVNSQNIKIIMATQAQLAADLRDLKAQNDKATAEQQAALAKLQEALDNAGNTTPEVDAAMAELKTSIQRDDDLNADEETPTEPGEPTEEPVEPTQP